MTRTLTRLPEPPSEEQPFYGWRFINHVRPDGTVEVETKLLTLEDVLHPQEGDVIPENSVYVKERGYLGDTFWDRESRLDRGLVLSDCLVDWGIEGLKNHSPDISVFAGLQERPPEPIGTFRLRASGGRCLAAIELGSPHTRDTDLAKVVEYHRAAVPLFVMIHQKKLGGPRELRVFRYAPDAFTEERPDRVRIEPLGLWLGLKDNRVVCYDAETGEEIGDYSQVQQARAAAELRAHENAEARAVAEQARQAAEQRAREAAQARAAAEHQARQDAQARAIAEQARAAAEQRAHDNAQARTAADEARRAAEERLHELEAELRRLRAKDES